MNFERLDRREFLKYILSSSSLLLTSNYLGLLSCSGKEIEKSLTNRKYFPQSVASGDIYTFDDKSGGIIWTRVEPDPTNKLSELPVIYQLSEDRSFTKIVAQNVVKAIKDSDYTVKVNVSGLSPGKKYFYRFLYKGFLSPVGEFKTTSKNLDRVRFAFVSCDDYTNGFYSAYYHLANEDIDFVVHLGDYIYETVGTPTFQYAQERKIQLNEYGVAYNLSDYRNLYKIYKSDPNFQRVHERFPFYVIWDDHEFANDCAGSYSFDNGKEIYGSDLQEQRRLEASRAYWEFLPCGGFFDQNSTKFKEQIRLYRSFRFGNLFHLIITDERLYRDPHPCGESMLGERYAARFCDNIERTSMLGKEQLDWFLKEIETAENEGVIWKVHANEVSLSQMALSAGETKAFLNLDQWDGYAGERKRIFSFLKQKNIKNYFAITGDLHTFVVGELYEDFSSLRDPVGVEFVATSITSANLGSILRIEDENVLRNIEGSLVELNKNLKFFNSHYHGYCIVELTPEEAICELWKVSSIEEPEVENTKKELVKRYRVIKNTNKIEDISPSL